MRAWYVYVVENNKRKIFGLSSNPKAVAAAQAYAKEHSLVVFENKLADCEIISLPARL